MSAGYLWAVGKHTLLPAITEEALLESHFQTPSGGSENHTGLGGALASSHGPCQLFAAANRSIKAQLEGPWAVLEQTNSQSTPRPGRVTPQGVSSSPHQELIVPGKQMRALRPQTAK